MSKNYNSLPSDLIKIIGNFQTNNDLNNYFIANKKNAEILSILLLKRWEELQERDLKLNSASPVWNKLRQRFMGHDRKPCSVDIDRAPEMFQMMSRYESQDIVEFFQYVIKNRKFLFIDHLIEKKLDVFNLSYNKIPMSHPDGMDDEIRKVSVLDLVTKNIDYHDVELIKFLIHHQPLITKQFTQENGWNLLIHTLLEKLNHSIRRGQSIVLISILDDQKLRERELKEGIERNNILKNKTILIKNGLYFYVYQQNFTKKCHFSLVNSNQLKEFKFPDPVPIKNLNSINPDSIILLQSSDIPEVTYQTIINESFIEKMSLFFRKIKGQEIADDLLTLFCEKNPHKSFLTLVGLEYLENVFFILKQKQGKSKLFAESALLLKKLKILYDGFNFNTHAENLIFFKRMQDELLNIVKCDDSVEEKIIFKKLENIKIILSKHAERDNEFKQFIIELNLNYGFEINFSNSELDYKTYRMKLFSYQEIEVKEQEMKSLSDEESEQKGLEEIHDEEKNSVLIPLLDANEFLSELYSPLNVYIEKYLNDDFEKMISKDDLAMGCYDLLLYILAFIINIASISQSKMPLSISGWQKNFLSTVFTSGSFITRMGNDLWIIYEYRRPKETEEEKILISKQEEKCIKNFSLFLKLILPIITCYFNYRYGIFRQDRKTGS